MPFNSRYYGTDEPMGQILFLWRGLRAEENRVFRAWPIGAKQKKNERGQFRVEGNNLPISLLSRLLE